MKKRLYTGQSIMASSFHFSWLKFPVDAYFYSDFRYESSAFAKAAFLDLLCLAVKRTPLFSIPNNDHTLAHWTGLSLRKWRSIKNQVLAMFEFNEEHNCYFCSWLQQQYQDSNLKDTHPKPDSVEKRALTNAERSRNYRQRQKDKHENVTASVTENVTHHHTEHHDDRHAEHHERNVTNLEDKKEENREKDNIKQIFEVKNTPTRTGSFTMFWDWKPNLNSFNVQLKNLNITTPHHEEHLKRFIAYYQAKNQTQTQEQWEQSYAYWLQRERNIPAESLRPRITPANQAPDLELYKRLGVDMRPQWQIFAERKQQAAEKAKRR